MPNSTVAVIAVALTILSVLPSHAPARQRALSGTILVALSQLALERALALRGSADASFLLVNGAIFAAGLCLIGLAVVLAFRAGDPWARLAPLAVVALALVVHWGVGGHVPLLAIALGAGAAAVVHGAMVLIPPAAGAAMALPGGKPWWVGAILAISAALAPHLVVLALAVVLLLAWCRWWVRTALLVALLSAVLVLTSAIAGPIGLGLATLGEVPYSPYAATIVGGALLLAAFVVAGVVPFAWDGASALLAPLGAVLLVRVVLPAVPEGVVHWRSLAAGWLVVAALIAAARGLRATYLAALGLFVLVAGEGRDAEWSGVALTLLAGAAVLLACRGGSARWPTVAGAAAVAGAGALGLGATLQHEVVYTVLMCAGAVLLVARSPQWLAKTDVRALASNETTS